MRFAFLVSPTLGYRIPNLFQIDDSFVEFEKALRLLRENGFNGVELNLNIEDDQLLSRIQKIIERSGLQLAATGTGLMFAFDKLSFTDAEPSKRSEAVSKVKKLVGFAAKHKAIVIIGLIRGTTTLENNSVLETFRACVRECDSEAERFNGKLALEAINRYETKSLNTADEVSRFIEESDLKATGMLLDTFHMNIEEKSFEDSIRTHFDKIFHFHIADSNRWPPGYGHLDIRSQLTLLAELGYKGWVSAETLPKPSGPESVIATAKFLAGSRAR